MQERKGTRRTDGFRALDVLTAGPHAMPRAAFAFDDGQQNDDDDTDGGIDDGGGNEPAPPSGSSGSASTDDTVTREQLEAERKRREKLEKELAAKRKEEEERKKAEMSEVERARAEAEEARAEAEAARHEARELRIANAIRDRLVEEGLSKPDAIVVNGIRSSLELDDDGDPINLDATVESFRDTYAPLFADDQGGAVGKKKQTANPNTGSGKEGDRGGGDDEELTDEERGRAARERYADANKTRI